MRPIEYNTDLVKQSYNYKACMQGDDLKIKLNIYNNSLKYDLTGATAKLNWAKPDGTPKEKENDITIENNTISCVLNEEYTDVHGKAKFEFEITKDGKITTFPLQLIIAEKVFQSEVVNNKIVELLNLVKIDDAIDDFMDGIKKEITSMSSEIDETVNNVGNLNLLGAFPTNLVDTINSSNVYGTNFGIKADGITDDTYNFQLFINYVVSNHKIGILPKGTIVITDSITIPPTPQWGLIGTGFGGTMIQQETDNIPIIILEEGTGNCHSIIIDKLDFKYKNPQENNTEANCIYIKQMIYQCSFTKLKFFSGYYGIKVKEGIGAPWGINLDEIIFGSNLYGGGMDWTRTTNGVPNNHFGRIYVAGNNMSDYVFKNIRGYNFIIDTIEFTATYKGAGLISFSSGTECTIGAIKLENGTYTKSTTLIYAPGCKIKLGQLHIGGDNTTFDSSNGIIEIIKLSAQALKGWMLIDNVVIDSNVNVIGSVYIIGGNSIRMIIKCFLNSNPNFWLTNAGGSEASETLLVENYNNLQLSSDKGDADYTITLGDPNIIVYETPLSTVRSVYLPSNNNSLFNGLTYKIISNGAVNGTNYLKVCSDTRIIKTIESDRIAIEIMYRRNASNGKNGWIITNIGNI